MQASIPGAASISARGGVVVLGLGLAGATLAWCSAALPPYVPPPATCVPAEGLPPTDCGLYAEEAAWLPAAYVTNATCACSSLPDDPTANCVRAHLQATTRATPWHQRTIAARMASLKHTAPVSYELWLDEVFTPTVYEAHQAAYAACCCPSGPAPFVDWMGVTNVALPSCGLVEDAIDDFGSCHGTPGSW